MTAISVNICIPKSVHLSILFSSLVVLSLFNDYGNVVEAFASHSFGGPKSVQVTTQLKERGGDGRDGIGDMTDGIGAGTGIGAGAGAAGENDIYNASAEGIVATAINRRQFAFSIPATIASASASASMAFPSPGFALDEQVAAGAAATTVVEPVQAVATGDVKKLFNEGRVLESQGNIPAAQRLFAKVTKVAPRVSTSTLYNYKHMFSSCIIKVEIIKGMLGC